MTWDYNETTHQALDANGGSVTGLSLVSISGAAPSFEPDEDYLGKYWASSTTPAIEVTCVDGGADSVYIFQFDLGAGNTIDLTDVLVQFWFLYTAKTGETLQNSDAIRLRVSDSGDTNLTTNYHEYELTGAVNGGIGNTNDPNGVKTYYADPLPKSFVHFAIGGANRITTTAGTAPDLTDIRRFGVVLRHQASNTGNNPAFAFDWLKSGNKFTVTGTDTMAGFRTFNDGVPEDRGDNPDYGLETGVGDYYEPIGAVDVGNGTTSTTLSLANEIIGINQFAEEVTFDWTVTNNATLNVGVLDTQAQDDYPVQGCTFFAPDEVYFASYEFQNGSTGNLYASRFLRWKDFKFGVTTAGTDPTIDVRSCDFDTIRNIEFRSTNLDLLDTDFHDPSPTFLNAAAAFSDDAGTFTAVTTNWNNDTTTTTIFPATETTADGHVFGFGEQFGSVEFEISTAGTVGVVNWQYWNGSAWTNLSNVVDGTDSFKAAASVGAFNRYRVTWDIPSNWATRNISGTTAYYIRASITTVFTVNPQIRQGRIGQRRVGILVDAPNSVQNIRFYKCDRALYFQSSVTVNEYRATDNAYDIVVDNNLTVTLINSTFDADKILQV